MDLTPTSQLPKGAPLLEQKPVGCALMDRDGRIVSVTRSFAKMLGCPGSQLAGRSVLDILARKDSSKRQDLLTEDAMFGVMTLDTGRAFLWNVHGIAPGAVLGGYYVGILYRTSDVEVYEHQLANLDRLALLGGLSAEMAHEIAGPLSVIANNADLLLEEGGVDHEARQFLIRMRDEAYRLGNVLQDFLFVARGGTPKMGAQNIVRLIETPVRLLHLRSHRENINVRIEAEPDLPQVVGDAEGLQQVFFNLVKNAYDASHPGSEVRIQVGRAEANQTAAMLEVAVIDQGEGIDPQDLERIFQPFYSTKREGQGTGLGLTISQRIVGEHHGELTIRSTPGVGTRATVLLPIL
jgi:signal transduction histidine kinase